MKHIFNYKHFTKIIALTALTSLVFTGCGNNSTAGTTSGGSSSGSSASTDKLTTVNFGVVTNSPTHWVSILEEETGIFAKHGIKLASTEFSMGINAVDAMALNQVDFTSTADYAGVNRIGNTADKTNFRYLAETATGSTGSLLYVNPKVIKKPADLEGKTVITIAGTVYDYYYAKLFEKYKLDKSKIKTATVSSAAEAAAIAESDGDGVAYWASAGSDGKQLEQAGWKTLLSLKDIDLSLHQYINGSSDFVEKNPKVTQEFLTAYEESLEYIYAHLDETAKFISKKTGLDENAYKAVFNNDTYELTFSQDSYDALQEINTWCRGNGNFTTDYDVADYILIDPLKAAYPDKVTLKTQK